MNPSEIFNPERVWFQYRYGPPESSYRSGRTVEHIDNHYHVRLKSGKLSKRAHWDFADYCPLDECTKCDRLMAANRVRCRWEMDMVSEWAFGKRRSQDEMLMCFSCWNRLRNKYRALWNYMQCESLIGKIRRTITHVRKRNRGTENNGRTSSTSRENSCPAGGRTDRT